MPAETLPADAFEVHKSRDFYALKPSCRFTEGMDFVEALKTARRELCGMPYVVGRKRVVIFFGSVEKMRAVRLTLLRVPDDDGRFPRYLLG